MRADDSSSWKCPPNSNTFTLKRPWYWWTICGLFAFQSRSKSSWATTICYGWKWRWWCKILQTLRLKSSCMCASRVVWRLQNWIPYCIDVYRHYEVFYRVSSQQNQFPWSFLPTTQWIYGHELTHEEEFEIGYGTHAGPWQLSRRCE